MDDEAVIDASVAVKLFLEEEYSPTAKALISALSRAGVRTIAPRIFTFEVANALHKQAHAGALTPTAAARLFRQLRTYEIDLLAPDDLHERAIVLAAELGQGAVYDSHYLALAEARDCEFWTADHRFYNAIQRVSSPLADRARWLADFDPGT